MKIEVDSATVATILPDVGKTVSATSTTKGSPASDQVAAEEALDFHQQPPPQQEQQQWRPKGLIRRLSSILSPRKKNAKDAAAAIVDNKISSKLSFRKQAINNQTQINNSLEHVLAPCDLTTEAASVREGGANMMQLTKTLYSPFGSTRSLASDAQNLQESAEIKRGGSAVVGPSGSSRRNSILYGIGDPHIMNQSRRNSLSRVWQQVGGRMLFCGSGHISGMVEELLERRGMAPLEYYRRTEDSPVCEAGGRGDGEGRKGVSAEDEDERLDEDYWMSLAESILKRQQQPEPKDAGCSSRSLIAAEAATERSCVYVNNADSQQKRVEWKSKKWLQRRKTDEGMEQHRWKQVESEEDEQDEEDEIVLSEKAPEIERLQGNALGGSFNSSSSYNRRRRREMPLVMRSGRHDGSSTTRLNTTLDDSPCLLHNHLQRAGSGGDAGSSISAGRGRCRSAGRNGETSTSLSERTLRCPSFPAPQRHHQQALEKLLLEERQGERNVTVTKKSTQELGGGVEKANNGEDTKAIAMAPENEEEARKRVESKKQKEQVVAGVGSKTLEADALEGGSNGMAEEAGASSSRAAEVKPKDGGEDGQGGKIVEESDRSCFSGKDPVEGAVPMEALPHGASSREKNAVEGGGRVSLQVLLEEENEAVAAAEVAAAEEEDADEEEMEEGGWSAAPLTMAEEKGSGAAAMAEGYGVTACCVCMVRRKGAALIPCGHTFCRACAKQLFVERGACALCNNLISQILDIF